MPKGARVCVFQRPASPRAADGADGSAAPPTAAGGGREDQRGAEGGPGARDPPRPAPRRCHIHTLLRGGELTRVCEFLGMETHTVVLHKHSFLCHVLMFCLHSLMRVTLPGCKPCVCPVCRLHVYLLHCAASLLCHLLCHLLCRLLCHLLCHLALSSLLSNILICLEPSYGIGYSGLLWLFMSTLLQTPHLSCLSSSSSSL